MHTSLNSFMLFIFTHRHIYFKPDTIKEKLKDRKNAHFMLVDGMSKLLTEKVKNCQSLDFQVSGVKW